MTESVQGGFLVPVEIKFISDVVGRGVFSTGFIEKGTLMWTPGLVKKYTPDEAKELLSRMSREEAHEWLRQTFIVATELDLLCSNVSDDGRLTNHSSNPNGGYASAERPSVALRDIQPGEELTVNYSGLGSPPWYKELCAFYGVLPTDEVARLYP